MMPDHFVFHWRLNAFIFNLFRTALMALEISINHAFWSPVYTQYTGPARLKLQPVPNFISSKLPIQRLRTDEIGIGIRMSLHTTS